MYATIIMVNKRFSELFLANRDVKRFQKIKSRDAFCDVLNAHASRRQRKAFGICLRLFARGLLQTQFSIFY